MTSNASALLCKYYTYTVIYPYTVFTIKKERQISRASCEYMIHRSLSSNKNIF